MASVPQIETVAVDELPGLDLGADELTIEWDEFDDGPTDVATLPEVDEFELAMFDPFREGVDTETDNGADREVEAASVEFADTSVVDLSDVDADVVDADALEGADPEADDEWADSFILVGEPDDETVDDQTIDDETVDVVPVGDDEADFHFEVTWPDGTEEVVAAPTDVAASPEGIDTSNDAPAFVETDDGELQFEIPPLELSDDEAVADEVPDDVASAVRRAIAAIESAAGAPVLAAVDTPVAEAPVGAEPVESAGVPAAAEITTQFAAVEGGAAPQGFARVRAADDGHARRGDVRQDGGGGGDGGGGDGRVAVRRSSRRGRRPGVLRADAAVARSCFGRVPRRGARVGAGQRAQLGAAPPDRQPAPQGSLIGVVRLRRSSESEERPQQLGRLSGAHTRGDVDAVVQS